MPSVVLSYTVAIYPEVASFHDSRDLNSILDCLWYSTESFAMITRGLILTPDVGERGIVTSMRSWYDLSCIAIDDVLVGNEADGRPYRAIV